MPARATTSKSHRSQAKTAAPPAPSASARIPARTLSKKRQRIRSETRSEMLERLSNPLISLHEASVLLKVCRATVRNYSNAGYLPHVRTEGGQRRFHLRDVLNLLRQHEAERK